jgi:hypothetical protein
MRRPAGQQGARRRRSPGGLGGRCGGGGCGGGRCEEDGDEEPERLGQVGEEVDRVPGADGGMAGGGGREGVCRSVDDRFREAGGCGESRGAEDGGAAEGGGWGG